MLASASLSLVKAQYALQHTKFYLGDMCLPHVQKEQLDELCKEAERLHLKSFPTFIQSPKLLPDQRPMRS